MNAEKYTTKVREALEAAQNVARHHGQQQIDVEHLLFALVKDSQGLVPNLFSKMGAGTGPLTARLEQAINDKPRITGNVEMDKVYISNDLANVLMHAEDTAQRMKDEYVSVEHLVLGMLADEKMACAKLLKDAGVETKNFLEALRAVRGNQRVTTDNPEGQYEALKKYGTDLVELARAG